MVIQPSSHFQQRVYIGKLHVENYIIYLQYTYQGFVKGEEFCFRLLFFIEVQTAKRHGDSTSKSTCKQSSSPLTNHGYIQYF